MENLGESLKIAVIIAAKGSCVQLDECLASLAGQTYKNYDVILVDDGLSDEAKIVAHENAIWITVLENNEQGVSAARNLGAAFTDAEYIAFIDADCIADENWLSELILGLKSDDVAVSCGGTQQIPLSASVFEQRVAETFDKMGFLTDYIKKSNQEIVPVAHNPSCNVIYDRKVFVDSGGFLVGLWPGEDVELDYRLRKKGYTLLFNSKAVVSHYRSKNWLSFWKMMSRYGWAQGILLRKFGLFRRIHFLSFIALILMSLLIFSFYKGVGIFTLIGALFGLFIYSELNIYVFMMILSGGLLWFLFFFKGFLFPSIHLKGYLKSNTD